MLHEQFVYAPQFGNCNDVIQQEAMRQYCRCTHAWIQILKKNSELAVREMMEVNIPENLENLKRPALQKLCKRLGLKANGKVQSFCHF